MIEARSVTKRYGDKQVLDSFSLQLPQEGIVCFFGPSGCGKTTLMRVLTGLEKPEGGEIVYSHSLRIAHVFQQDRLLYGMSAEQNVRAVAPQEGDFLLQLGLDAEREQRVQDLSGGMQRRVSLAHALAYGGDVYALDEPLKGIDERMKHEIMDVIREETAGKLVLLITHDIDEALLLARDIYVLDGIPLHVLRHIQLNQPISQDELHKWKNEILNF